MAAHALQVERQDDSSGFRAAALTTKLCMNTRSVNTAPAFHRHRGKADECLSAGI